MGKDLGVLRRYIGYAGNMAFMTRCKYSEEYGDRGLVS